MPYCLNCDYDLTGSEGRCPECGREFSLDDRTSYQSTPGQIRNNQRGNYIAFALAFSLALIAIYYEHVWGLFLLVSVCVSGIQWLYRIICDRRARQRAQREFAAYEQDYFYSKAVGHAVKLPPDMIHLLRYLVLIASPDDRIAYSRQASEEGQEITSSSATELCDRVPSLARELWHNEAQNVLKDIGLCTSDDLGRALKTLASGDWIDLDPEDDFDDFIGYCKFIDDKPEKEEEEEEELKNEEIAQTELPFASKVGETIGRSGALIHFLRHVIQIAPKSARKKVEISSYQLSASNVCDLLAIRADECWGDNAKDKLKALGLNTSDDLGEILKALADADWIDVDPEDDFDDFKGYCSFT